MITVLHGDDSFKSRQELLNITQNFQFTHYFKEKEISPENLTKLTGQLFSSKNEAIVLEEMFKLPPKSLQKTFSLLKKLKEKFQIFIWEEKTIEGEKIKLIPTEAKVLTFRTPPFLFKFLDSLEQNTKSKLNLFQKIITDQPLELILFMIEKRLHELLLAQKSPDLLSGKQWQKNKIIFQAKKIDFIRLKKMYLNLIKIDWKSKTGRLGGSLEEMLRIWLLSF